MSPLATLGLFALLFLFVLLVSVWRDAPRRSRAKYQSHDWLVTEHREARLKAAAMPHLFKGYKMPTPNDPVVILPGKSGYRIVVDGHGPHYENVESDR